MNTKENTIHFNRKEVKINNSMLLFLGSGVIDGEEYALWSLVAFNGNRVNDSEQSKIYLDIEFATPLTHTQNGTIKLLDIDDKLFFSKVHHIRIGGENIKVEKQEKGTIQLLEFFRQADKISYKSVVVIDGSLLEISYNGKTKLIVMQ